MKTKFIYFTTLLFLAFFNLQGQENKAESIIRQYFSMVDNGQFESIGSLLTDDISVSAPFSPVAIDKTGWLGTGQMFKTAFPDMEHEIVRWFADDNNAVVEGIFKGTNTGSMMGNPPTGNAVNLGFNTIFEFDGKGKIKRINVKFDQKAFEAQLMKGINPSVMHEQHIRQMLKAADMSDVDNFASFWTPDSKNWFAGEVSDITTMKNRIIAFNKAFPDIERKVVAVQVCGNSIFVRGELNGTNTGMFMGKEATGNKVHLTWLGEYQFNAEGKFTAGWVESDFSQIKTQLHKTSLK